MLPGNAAIVSSLGMLSDLFNGCNGDLQQGNEKVTLNIMVCFDLFFK